MNSLPDISLQEKVREEGREGGREGMGRGERREGM